MNQMKVIWMMNTFLPNDQSLQKKAHWVPTLQVLTKFLQLHPRLIDFHLYNASKSNIDAFTDEFLSTRDDDNNRPVWFCPLIRPLAFLLDDL